MDTRRFNDAKRGMTAIEVVASTLLASLLMVAMIGVLRGLKAQEAALDTRMPTPSWQHTLKNVLEHDLLNSRTYRVTPTALTLQGFAGRNFQSGLANWLPATIVYEIVEDGQRNWLVRRDAMSQELVLADVASIRIGLSTETLLPQTTSLTETPITSGLSIQFWGHENTEGPLYGYRFRRP